MALAESPELSAVTGGDSPRCFLAGGGRAPAAAAPSSACPPAGAAECAWLPLGPRSQLWCEGLAVL